MHEVTEKTGEFFEGYAGQFDEIYELQTQRGLRGWLNRRLRASMLIRYERTFAALEPMAGRAVLDVGCGSGRYLAKSLDSGAARVAGIDLGEEMLSLAREILESQPAFADRFELIHGDFLTHDFGAVFDYAIVMGVMDYIDNPGEFLRRLSGLVTKRAVFSFPAAESVWSFQRKIRYRLRGCPLYLYGRDRLEALMRESGFRTCSIDRIARDYFVCAEH